ncbi:MAG TPA: MIP/aquaporin family protein [Bryobacteraceae bacterium]|nr:MIP/aquaporin family protein [Bryobacteraceae bacterium]
MDKRILGEFLGTMILVLLGNGVVANVQLRKSKAEGAGWMAIATGWAFAVMAGIFTATACGSPDAHINPAVTLGFAVSSGDFSRLAYYIPAQIAGAFAGAVLVWLHFYPHWRETPDADVKLGCFSTSPAIHNVPFNVLSEVVATFVLVLVVGAIGSRSVTAAGLGTGHGPYLISCLVWGIGLSLGGTTGYAINPARDLGPRIAHAVLPIAKKGPSNWSYAGVPVFGPLAGAVLAGFVIRWTQV